jgi:hypothetical protein
MSVSATPAIAWIIQYPTCTPSGDLVTNSAAVSVLMKPSMVVATSISMLPAA